jgi:hypothetical protein
MSSLCYTVVSFVMILFESEIKGCANYMMKMVFLYSISLYFTKETNFCWLKNTFCSELEHVFPSFNKLPSSENSHPKDHWMKHMFAFRFFFFYPFNFVRQPEKFQKNYAREITLSANFSWKMTKTAGKKSLFTLCESFSLNHAKSF